MYVGAIDATAAKIFEIGISRMRRLTTEKELPPPPASAQATETARAQANSSVFMLQLMKPTLDGIFIVSSTGVKVSGPLKAVSSAQSWNLWGF
jgi:hypothetical protein